MDLSVRVRNFTDLLRNLQDNIGHFISRINPGALVGNRESANRKLLYKFFYHYYFIFIFFTCCLKSQFFIHVTSCLVAVDIAKIYLIIPAIRFAFFKNKNF